MHIRLTLFKMMKYATPDVQPTLQEMVWITSIHCDFTYRSWCAPLSDEFHKREFFAVMNIHMVPGDHNVDICQFW